MSTYFNSTSDKHSLTVSPSRSFPLRSTPSLNGKELKRNNSSLRFTKTKRIGEIVLTCKVLWKLQVLQQALSAWTQSWWLFKGSRTTHLISHQVLAYTSLFSPTMSEVHSGTLCSSNQSRCLHITSAAQNPSMTAHHSENSREWKESLNWLQSPEQHRQWKWGQRKVFS